MRFLVTGCGRSGTRYIAERLVASGVSCGHEKVFSVTGPLDNFDCFEGDSSWFAAPFFNTVEPSLKVLHIVREPRSVIESFHRIGLFKTSRFRHFSGGRSVVSTAFRFNCNVKKIRNRIEYIDAHRKLLADHTTCWEAPDEFHRLCEYWYQWNTLIENNAYRADLPYFRIRLEELDNRWADVEAFLEIENPVIPGCPSNQKSRYRSVGRFRQILPGKVVELARKYGFEN